MLDGHISVHPFMRMSNAVQHPSLMIATNIYQISLPLAWLMEDSEKEAKRDLLKELQEEVGVSEDVVESEGKKVEEEEEEPDLERKAVYELSYDKDSEIPEEELKDYGF